MTFFSRAPVRARLHASLIAVAASAALGAIALPASAQTPYGTTSTTTATAQPRAQFLSSGYLGLNLGRSRYDANCGNGTFGCDRTDNLVHLYSGSMFSDYFGAEIGYVDFGEMARGGGDTRAQGLNFSLVGRAPVASAVSLFGKLGTTYGRTRTSAVAGSGVTAGNESGWGLSYGVGVSYDFTPRMSAVLSLDSHDLKFAGSGRDAIRTTSIGLQYRF
jgi:hypothetical protein